MRSSFKEERLAVVCQGLSYLEAGLAGAARDLFARLHAAAGAAEEAHEAEDEADVADDEGARAERAAAAAGLQHVHLREEGKGLYQSGWGSRKAYIKRSVRENRWLLRYLHNSFPFLLLQNQVESTSSLQTLPLMLPLEEDPLAFSANEIIFCCNFWQYASNCVKARTDFCLHLRVSVMHAFSIVFVHVFPKSSQTTVGRPKIFTVTDTLPIIR